MKLKDLSTKYDFKTVESGKYEKWIQEGYFTAGDISKKPYTIVIPPPNITGKLHLGHALDTTQQDIIIRRKRMQGYDTLYLPGMDHASIATQAKVEARLREQGISRYDIGREKFLEISWQWKEEYASIIRKQWEAIGLSLDYTRERFTLDEGLNQAVNEVFIRMYKDGIIYRGEKIINWDIQSKTALSNIEVDYKNVEGAFYHIIYPFVDGEGGLEIATTRPETMFGDTALMVHPNDERYQQFIGKEVYIPGTTTKIPVISDEYVDMSFGTGVVKVTPAHDPNDFEVGLRHQLARPLCMEEDGTMSAIAGKYQGMERFSCRKAVVEDLKQAGLCVKIKKMTHSVGHSERTGVIVEPRLSKQWFVAMDSLAKNLLAMQANPETKITFVPARFEKIFANWLNNIQDWCISRQLWWGHRIPAWYKEDQIYVGLTAPKEEGWAQDEDALDTWFSSGLWPFSTLGWPKDTFDFNRYFPTDTLVTGYDIIFFWVARMAFQSQYLLGQRPFKKVLIHGIIRDEIGRKISKSLGNGVDMLEAIEKYGADSLRYFITTSSAPGLDFRYSEEKIEAAWNFINKIWNISRFIGLNFESNNYQKELIKPELLNTVDKWMLSRLNKTIKAADDNYERFDFGEAAKAIYKFTWNDFASWYLEMTKVTFQTGTEREKINTCAVLEYGLTAILKLLHPFMPFVTEEIYQKYHEGSITVSSWPLVNKDYAYRDASKIEVIYDIITAVRTIRTSKNVPNSKKITLLLETHDQKLANFIQKNINYLSKFTNFSSITIEAKELDKKLAIVQVLPKVTVIVPLKALINVEEEKQKLTNDKEKVLAEIKRAEQMLQNPGFALKAPKEKVEAEKTKLENYKQQLLELEKLLQELA
ncbi:MAG TPA: valine--tRNA ligase [Candidatus Paceibacterota bacterium]|nr:valine--tRNA ligase [Candidatus Paceibacterota bacterium]